MAPAPIRENDPQKRREAVAARRDANDHAAAAAISAGNYTVVDFAMVGAGMAAVASAALRHQASGGAAKGLLVAPGRDLWDTMGTLPIGQRAEDLAVAGLSVRPGDVAGTAAHGHDERFVSSAEAATPTMATQLHRDLPRVDARVLAVEGRPGDTAAANGWPEGARARMLVRQEVREHGQITVRESWIFSRQPIDVTTGMGDTPRAFDEKTLPAATRAKMEGRTAASGFQHDPATARLIDAQRQLEFMDSLRPGQEIVVQAGGPSSAWVAEAAAKAGVKVKWIAREEPPAVIADNLGAVNDPDVKRIADELRTLDRTYKEHAEKLRLGATTFAGDLPLGGSASYADHPDHAASVATIREALARSQALAVAATHALEAYRARVLAGGVSEVEALTIENTLAGLAVMTESHAGGMLPRNQETWHNHAISRVRGDVVHVQEAPDGDVLLFLNDGTVHKTSRMVTSMGYIGTLDAMLATTPEMAPITGDQHRAGQGAAHELHGLQSTDGGVRILGAAATTGVGALKSWLGNDDFNAYWSYVLARSQGMSDSNSRGVLQAIALVIDDRMLGATLELLDDPVQRQALGIRDDAHAAEMKAKLVEEHGAPGAKTRWVDIERQIAAGTYRFDASDAEIDDLLDRAFAPPTGADNQVDPTPIFTAAKQRDPIALGDAVADPPFRQKLDALDQRLAGPLSDAQRQFVQAQRDDLLQRQLLRVDDAVHRGHLAALLDRMADPATSERERLALHDVYQDYLRGRPRGLADIAPANVDPGSVLGQLLARSQGAAPTEDNPTAEQFRAQHGVDAAFLQARFPDGVDDPARRAEWTRALGRWGPGANGRNQGLDHILYYAEGGGGPGKTNRLEKLAEYTGTGPYDPKDPAVLTQATAALDKAVTDQAYGQPRGEGGKEIFFVPKVGSKLPPDNKTKGLVIIKFAGRYSTFMNATWKDYQKME